MTMPSRDFLVRQAVLNAATVISPEGVKILGAGRWLKWSLLGDWVRPSLCDEVRAQFRKLVSQYEHRSDFGEDLMRIGAGGLK